MPRVDSAAYVVSHSHSRQEAARPLPPERLKIERCRSDGGSRPAEEQYCPCHTESEQLPCVLAMGSSLFIPAGPVTLDHSPGKHGADMDHCRHLLSYSFPTLRSTQENCEPFEDFNRCTGVAAPRLEAMRGTN